ncbi:hypothetical protein BFG52_00780 [Acinetobacter larvae]|uniref:Secretin/TonB short N-terminal domain-containing protein n=1 Tax=Acinetobacter larvae TaxID=1789224 RepID=A0A1B2M3R1_9GAMM|nr:hypothetical protein BFG52_00780 [Acinetobacter larvae]
MVQAAPAQTLHYRIPASSLDHALILFSAQSEIEFVFDPKGIKHLQSQGLQGSYSVDAGLTALLAPHGLEAQQTSRGYILRTTAPQPTSTTASATQQQQVTAPLGVNLPVGQTAVVAQMSPIILNAQATAADAVYKANASSTYLSAEALNRFNRSSPSDILKGIAGVQTGDSRNGGALDVNIRGIQGMGRVAVTVDGAQQAIESYRGYAGTSNRSYIPTELISHVTIEKGPNTRAGSAGGIAGTVAMQTIGVKDILLEGQQQGARLTGNLWSNSVDPQTAEGAHDYSPRHSSSGLSQLKGRSGSIAVATQSEKFDVVAAYATQHQGNYYAGKHGSSRYDGTPQMRTVADVYKAGEEVLNTSNQSESFLLKTTIRPTDTQSLELGYRYFDGEFGEIMGSALFRGNGSSIPQWPTGNMRINSYTAKYQYNPENPLINFKLNTWFSDAKNHQLNAGPTAPASQASTVSPDYNWSRLRNWRWGTDFSNELLFKPKWGDLMWTVGGSFLVEDIRPNHVEVTEEDRLNNRVLRDAKRYEASFLSQLNFKPTDKIELYAGGRYTYFRNEDRNRMAHRETIYSNKPHKRVHLSLRTATGWTRYGYVEWYPTQNGEYVAAQNPGELLLSGNSKDIMINAYGGPYTLEEFEKFLGGKVIGYDVDKNEQPGVIDRYEYHYDDKLKQSGESFAPFFGASYQLTDYAHVYASYKEAIRVPGLFETTMGTMAGLIPTDQALKPERSRNIEVGISAYKDQLFSTNDMARLKVNYFNTDIKNYIARYFNGEYLNMYNSDSYRVSGMELQAMYDVGQYFADLAVTKYFKARTCDAKIAQRIREQGLPDTPDCTEGGFDGSYVNTQNPPDHTIALTLGSRWLDNKLTLGTRMTQTSGPIANLNKRWQAQTTTFQIYYEPVRIFDVFANYQLKESLAVNFSIDNLTDRYYLDPLAQSYMPAPGRSYRLGASFKF